MWNDKRERHSQNKIAKSKFGLLFNMSMLIVIMLMITTGLYTAAHAETANVNDFLKIFGSGAVYCGLGMITLVEAPAKDGQPNQYTSEVYLLRLRDEVDRTTFPMAQQNNTIMPAIPRITGMYWHFVGYIEKSFSYNGKSEGDDAYIMNNEVKFKIRGLNETAISFINTNNGEKFIVGIKRCEDGYKRVLGSTCSGMKLKIDAVIDEKSESAEFSFTHTCNHLWMRYEGDFTLQTPDIVAADATTIPLTTNPEYQLSDGASSPASITAFSGYAATDVGRFVTVIGSGGAHPSTIATSATVLLKDGTQWAGTSGAKITFEIFKNGASSYALIERSRV
jgi:hypothetical protein